MANMFWDKVMRRLKKRPCVRPVTAYIILGIGVILLALVLTAAGLNNQPAATDSGATGLPNNTDQGLLKFAVISDTHIGQPPIQYSPIPMDNLKAVGAILKTKELDFVMDTGDVVDDLYCNWLLGCPGSPDVPDIMKRFTKLIHENFDNNVPFFVALGNHDDRYYTPPLFVTVRDYVKSAWTRAFGDVDSARPLSEPVGFDNGYYNFKTKGFNIVVLNSSAETPKDKKQDDTTAYNDGIHFGDTQLKWLDLVLGCSPEPAILFWHSTPFGDLVGKGEPTDATFRDNPYLKVLYDHRDKIRAVFVGHGHQFNEKDWQGISFYETTTTACYKKDASGKAVLPDYSVYFLVSADAAADGGRGTVTVTNRDDIDHGTGQWPPQCEIPRDPIHF
ncbi:MAG: metallophosphoesterase [Patescibacteria group bacterium]|nr:metallophosphoesterase [Patescibacteria group bacterium]